MRRSLLLITTYALLEALICALVVMTQLNIEWVILLPKYGQEKTITIPGVYYFFASNISGEYYSKYTVHMFVDLHKNWNWPSTHDSV